jgi:hypothetical protein
VIDNRACGLLGHTQIIGDLGNGPAFASEAHENQPVRWAKFRIARGDNLGIDSLGQAEARISASRRSGRLGASDM